MPEIDETLAVIDAALAGDAVAPEHAELAELALILADEGEAPSPAFARALDARVRRRFTEVPGAEPAPRRSRRRWLYAPGAAAALAAAAVAVAIIGSAGGGSSTQTMSTSASPPRSIAAGAGAGSQSSANSAPATSAGAASAPPTVVPNGRKIIQSSQLSLSTRADRVDNVAQQVFDVVASQNGVVNSSNVTASGSSGGYAQFQLSVPSVNLGQTLAALSRLHGAHVVSRTDATQDVTGQLGGEGRRLAEARALRTSLLRQLARATTSAQIASLKAQIRDADASIASVLGMLNALQHRVDFSPISLTISAEPVPVSGGGGFTIGRAAHDAARVLVVAAGVALIALAGLVPVGLLVALGVWVAVMMRRRRREQTLDVV